MSDDIAVRVCGLGKLYRVGTARERHESLASALGAALASPFTGFRRLRRLTRFDDVATAGGAAEDVVWALHAIDFEIRRGEVVGLIGRNGAGKSTLLKILSRITEPSVGHAEIYGRVGSLLEVGTGFHPDLTGRENVFINGTILGMRRREIAKKFDEIVAFAGVEKFIDTPVKRYSSGMRVRLAFAVAAYLQPEVLLVDEVLAVGDAEFQRKCLGKMNDIAGEGRTVIFVSHNMAAVQGLCRRGILLEKGRKTIDGPIEAAIEGYSHGLNAAAFTWQSHEFGFAIDGVTLRDAQGRATTQFFPGEDLEVEIEFRADRPLLRPYVSLSVESSHGTCFSATMLLDGRRPDRLDGAGRLSCRFRQLPLLPLTYTIKLGIRGENGRDHIVPVQDASSFQVVGDPADFGLKGEFLYKFSQGSFPVIIPYRWTMPDGNVVDVQLAR